MAGHKRLHLKYFSWFFSAAHFPIQPQRTYGKWTGNKRKHFPAPSSAGVAADVAFCILLQVLHRFSRREEDTSVSETGANTFSATVCPASPEDPQCFNKDGLNIHTVASSARARRRTGNIEDTSNNITRNERESIFQFRAIISSHVSTHIMA